MGTDYAQRKLAKKKWKKAGSQPSDGKKQRVKRNKIRRLCQGMCYGEPELKAEDKVWEKDSDGYDSEIEHLIEVNKEVATEPEAKGANDSAGQEPTVKSTKRPRMSTAVDLPAVSFSEPDPSHARKKQKALHPSDQSPVSQLGTHPAEIQRYMQAEGYLEPTQIQEMCWPECLKGRDVRAIAEPGSGKTLGYLLPALPWLLKRVQSSKKEASSSGPGVLILVPTRELAQQVAACCRNLRRLFNLETACIFGGGDRGAQEEAIQKNPHIVVATPGRLLDFVDASTLDISSVGYLVLDEADKMLSLGLQSQLDRIRAFVLPEQPAKKSKSKRPQVLLFTATMPAEVDETAQQWQREPVVLQVSASGASISRTVVQVVQVCAEHKKPKKLLKHLGQIKEASKGIRNPPRVLVFANRIKTVRFLHTTISAAGFKAATLHGDRTQAEREEAMRLFRSGKVQILVATDVAARGLHIRGLPYIINYDFPSRLEPYIHRVGRTGRLASSGHAFSFFTRNLAPLARPLLILLQEHEQSVDPNLLVLADAYDTAMAKLDGATADVWTDVPARGEAATDSDTEQAPHARHKDDQPSSSGNPSDEESADKENKQAAKRKPAESGPQGQRKSSVQGRRSLPGRLRKKLAKQRET
ncbi:hypothetical protein WJX75_006589 [Coccomyxa subellipsoidea]|uniref:DEAD-domain-containing protein n=1 Tax=Coccomyxa subellipsoidea TaxID=248742 RepID=A0ABR2Z098_9CHLO